MLESGMSSIDPVVQALQRLCARVGGHDALAAQIGANGQSIYQIVSERRLASGNPKGVGPQLRAKISEKYPGWLNEDAASPPPAPTPFDSAAAALEALAVLLNELPTQGREAVAQRIPTFVRAPDSKKALQEVLEAMAGLAGAPPSSGLQLEGSTPSQQALLAKVMGRAVSDKAVGKYLPLPPKGVDAPVSDKGKR